MTDGFAPDTRLVARVAPSPNFGERRGPTRPDCVILHYTGMPSAEAALALLIDPASQVSAHYLIVESGEIVQMVAEDKRAWHAGVGAWGALSDLNSASIGIEIANPGHEGGLPPFPARQIEATIALARDIMARRGVRRERILAHSDIAPARKRDPGEAFPWDALARAGVGHWVKPAPIDGEPLYRHGEDGAPVRALQAMLALYGYGINLTGVYDAPTRAVVAAFQRHFRPARVDGETDASTLATLKALIEDLQRA